MIVKFTDYALKDLERLKDFIAKDSQYYADSFVENVFEAVESLSLFPKMGRKVPEINEENTREIIYKSYRIIYKIDNHDTIWIVTIVHGSRELHF